MKMTRCPWLSIALSAGLAVCSGFAAPRPSSASPADDASANPFFQPSTLPYQAPPFDRIQDSHYQPALEEGMKQQLAEIAAIADNTESPTFANTI
jgi:peptidyl-dipeptidase Dcp